MKALNLNLHDDEIYYGSEASWQYMGVSQYKDFLRCEAQALAKVKGGWEPISDPIALLVGNYVHSRFESLESHENFKLKNASSLYKEPTIAQYKKVMDSVGIPYKKTGNKGEIIEAYESFEGAKLTIHGDMLSNFKVADKMIAVLEKEPFFNYLWQGEKELPITGELEGIEWKGKIDLLNIEQGYFVDLKTTARLDTKVWNNESRRYESFVEGYGYVLQMAVYEYLLEQAYGKPFTGYIYAVTKEGIPDIAAIEIPEEMKREALREMSFYIERVQAVKVGEEAPEGCGHCDYCKIDKQLEGFTDVRDLIN